MLNLITCSLPRDSMKLNKRIKTAKKSPTKHCAMHCKTLDRAIEYKNNGTCTAFITATTTDTKQTTMSCTSGVDDNYCGTLESSTARYRGCFDLNPATTTF